MVDVIDGSETVSTHGIVNWILLLFFRKKMSIFASYRRAMLRREGVATD